MNTKQIKTISVCAIALLAGCFGDKKDTDTLNMVDSWCFSGGPIYSANDDHPTLNAVAAKNGEITYITTESPPSGWCEKHAGKDAHNINLAGKALYPGFTDAHMHLLGVGLREMTLNLEGTKSIAELQSRLSEAVQNTDGTGTLYGRGWIETHWPENRFPTRQDLDAVAPERPVILERSDGHAMVANSAALDAAGITKNTEAPFGGDILRDADGNPTGMLIDKASALVDDLLPQLTPRRKRGAYVRGARLYAKRGWTNVHSMSVDPNDVDLINELAERGEIRIRVYNSVDASTADDVTRLAEATAPTSPLVTNRAIKLYSDGALGSRGAALHAPYADDPDNEGLMLIKPEQIKPIIETALRSGIQVNTHAIGDRANTQLLDWYEETLANISEGQRAIVNPRWRVEHAQILSLEDIERFQNLGVIASMQPSHAIGDLHFAIDRLGQQRLAGGYAWNTLVESGAIIAGGSDAPVEVGSPLIEFYAATVRKDLTGYSNDDWYMSEKVTPQVALKMFTIWPAYAAFQEDMVGTIDVGKRADFTVFDRDIMTAQPDEILDTRAVLTIVDGKEAFNIAKPHPRRKRPSEAKKKSAP